MTNSAQLSPLDKAQVHLPFNAGVMLAGSALLLAFAIAIALAAMSPGNLPDDIALMAAFP